MTISMGAHGVVTFSWSRGFWDASVKNCTLRRCPASSSSSCAHSHTLTLPHSHTHTLSHSRTPEQVRVHHLNEAAAPMDNTGVRDLTNNVTFAGRVTAVNQTTLLGGVLAPAAQVILVLIV